MSTPREFPPLLWGRAREGGIPEHLPWGFPPPLTPPHKGEGNTVGADLLSFFADRLKVHLREKGARHDLIDAVFALGGQDDLALIVKRVEALGEFLKTDDGANLLSGSSARPTSSATRRRRTSGATPAPTISTC